MEYSFQSQYHLRQCSFPTILWQLRSLGWFHPPLGKNCLGHVFFVCFFLFFSFCFFCFLSFFPFFHDCRSPQSFSSSVMKPITIVKRFLKGETPAIPLPPGIDESTSNPSTGSWLLVSNSPAQSNHFNLTKGSGVPNISNGTDSVRPPQGMCKTFLWTIHRCPHLATFFCT